MKTPTHAYYFLASPFNGTDEEKAYRYGLSQQVTILFLEQEISLFAPILYNQLLIESFKNIKLDDRRQLLMPMNIDFLMRSQGMILLKAEGWNTSWGMSHYVNLCKEHQIAVWELEPKNLESEIQKIVEQLLLRKRTDCSITES